MIDRCQHGYFTVQFSHVPCPWCFGVDSRNADVVPVAGKGNGWLLRRGRPACPDCGGPAGAGSGLIPPWMTREYYEQVIAPQPRLCMECAKARVGAGLPIPRVPGLEENEVPADVRAEARRRIEAATRSDPRPLPPAIERF